MERSTGKERKVKVRHKAPFGYHDTKVYRKAYSEVHSVQCLLLCNPFVKQNNRTLRPMIIPFAFWSILLSSKNTKAHHFCTEYQH